MFSGYFYCNTYLHVKARSEFSMLSQCRIRCRDARRTLDTSDDYSVLHLYPSSSLRLQHDVSKPTRGEP